MPQLADITILNSPIGGKLPPCLGNLTTLAHLELVDNKNLTGPIPPSLFQIGALIHVELVDSNFTGVIPNTFWQSKSIINAYFDRTNLLPSLPATAALDNLAKFTCVRCGMVGTIPTWLVNNTLRQYINLQGNQVRQKITSRIK